MSTLPKFILVAIPTQTLAWCSSFQSNVKIGEVVENGKETFSELFPARCTAFHSCGDDRVAGTGQGEPGDSPWHVVEPDSGRGASRRAMWERSVQECHGPELE